MLKVLVISRTPWRNDNSFGNSFSSILGGTEEMEIHNIYCAAGAPDNSVVSSCFQLSENMIIKSILKATPVGRRVPSTVIGNNKNIDEMSASQKKGFAFFQRNRLQVFHWCRDLIWSRLNLNCDSFKRYIADVEPDIIFLPVYYSSYTNRIGLEVKRITGAPMVGYISDDNYTLRQFSLSPFYWIDRFIKRGYVKRSIDKCEKLFVISEVQKQDYDIAFNKNCQILFKGADFSAELPISPVVNNTIQFLFTGNIGDNRYQTLAMLGSALDSANKMGFNGELHIYTATPLSNKILKSLKAKSIVLHKPVSFSDVKNLQQKADVLIHVEAFSLKERLLVRHSFSTKIVDYFSAGKPIMAIGPKEVASIQYLINEHSAIVATNANDLSSQIEAIQQDKDLLKCYAQKGWDCGKRNHQIETIQANLMVDINQVVDNYQGKRRSGVGDE